MIPVHAQLLDTFRAGKWRLMAITEPGLMKVGTKEGEVDQPFGPGDVVIATADGWLVCSPVSPAGAVDLAERILEGDARARTDPMAMIALAAAVCGFVQAETPPPSTEPKSAALAEG